MLNLDKSYRYDISSHLLDAAMFKSNNKVNVIYSDGKLLLKQDFTCYGVDKIIDIVTLSSKGRLILSKHVRELFSIDQDTILFAWFEPPGIIHIEKKD